MSIKTAGELRGFLTDILLGIRSGSVDVEEAKAIAQVASEITRSLAVEVNTALQLRRMGDNPPIAGSMQIASGSVEAIPLAERIIWCDQCERRVTGAEAEACASKHCKAQAA